MANPTQAELALQEQNWWKTLDHLAKRGDVAEYYRTYASYLEWSNIYSPSRKVIYYMAIRAAEELDSQWEKREKAKKLIKEVLKTWDPPEEGMADIATSVQTSSMITVAYLFGKDLFCDLKPNQQKALDSGISLLDDLVPSVK